MCSAVAEVLLHWLLCYYSLTTLSAPESATTCGAGLAVEKVEVVLINYVTPAAAVASPAGGPGLPAAPTGSYGASAPPPAARSASPGVIGGAIAGAVAGTGDWRWQVLCQMGKRRLGLAGKWPRQLGA